MINNKHAQHDTLIFLHIPKTAGTSIRKIFERFYDEKEIYPIYTKVSGMNDMNDFKALPDAEKMKIKVFFGHVSFGLHNYIPRPCHYVTILRDPVEKVLSLFSHVSNIKTNPYYAKIKSSNFSISDFVSSGMAVETDNHQTRVISGIDPEFGKCTTAILETAEENIKKYFSVVGLSEYFDESVLLMKKAFGWRPPAHLSLKRMIYGVEEVPSPFYEKANVSTNRLRKEDLSADEINTIIKYNELDIELYNYAEKLLQDKIRQEGASFKDELDKLKKWRNSNDK